MSILTSVGILLFSVFACAFLQLTPSVFLIFYHYASAKYSRKNALDFSSFFVVGVAAMTALVLFLLYFAIFHFLADNPGLNLDFYTWIVAGILIALGIFCLFFYYRKGPGTQLFISRNFAEKITLQARKVRKPFDAFSLGLATGTVELIFNLPIYIVVITEIINFPVENEVIRPTLLFLFTLCTMFSVLFVRGQFYNFGHNLAEIERKREKYKTFKKIMLSFSYFVLAGLLIAFRIFA